MTQIDWRAKFLDLEAATTEARKLHYPIDDGACAACDGAYAYPCPTEVALSKADPPRKPKVNGFEDLGVFEGGSSFGDHQVADVIGHRYRTQLRDGTWLVIEDEYAAVDSCAASHGANEDEECPYECEMRYSWEERITLTKCTDPDDIGMTEVWIDIQYGDGSVRGYSTAEEAHKSAQRHAQQDIRPMLSTVGIPLDATVREWTRWETFCARCDDLYGDAHDTEEEAREYAQKDPYCPECEEEVTTE